jgi:hypothetical protein
MSASLFLVLGLAVAFQQQPTQTQTGVIWGQVRSEKSGAPLRFATVELIAGGRVRMTAQTDANGFYQLLNVPNGRRTLRVAHIDHANEEIEFSVPAGQQIYLDFELALRPLRLPVVTARAPVLPGAIPDTIAVRAQDLGTASVHMLDATPGVAEFGLADAAREVPGHEPPDPSDVLYVRGGGADLKLILLNGAPVYAPFHIGGLINALDPDMLRSAALFLGGAPARYDGGLSYVMEMETRSGRGDQPRATMGVDLLAGRAVAEGPIGDNTTYLIGGRTVHGLGATPFVDDPFPYTYGDAIGRIDMNLGVQRTLTLTGFWNREFVRLDSIGTLDAAAHWGNNAGSLRYRGPVGGAEGVFLIAASDFRTRLPLGALQPTVTEGVSRRVRATADIGRSIGTARVSYGASFDRLDFESRAWLRGAPDSITYSRKASGDVAGAYVDATVSLGSAIRLRGGVRADVFSLAPTPRLAPRFAATMLMSDRSALTLAAGRYRQYVRSPDLSGTTITSTVQDQPNSPPLVVAEASHLVLALDQTLGEQMRLGIEGFYKMYDGLPEASGGESAEAAGADIWVRRSGARFAGWFGYSLAWIWSTERTPYSSRQVFAGRHLVSAGVNGPIMGRGVFDIRVAYGAGLPYTAIPEPEITTPVFDLVGHTTTSREPTPEVDTEPTAPYLRLDAQVARTFKAHMAGFAFALTPYVKVLNALDRRDALFYHLNRGNDGTELRALASLPVLPIVGFEWKF